jgi:hypothetical protein
VAVYYWTALNSFPYLETSKPKVWVVYFGFSKFIHNWPKEHFHFSTGLKMLKQLQTTLGRNILMSQM